MANPIVTITILFSAAVREIPPGTRSAAVTKVAILAMQCSKPATTNPEIQSMIMKNFATSFLHFMPQATARQTKKLQRMARKNISPTGMESLFPIKPA